MQYSKDGPFTEPLVRCDSCQKIVKVDMLKQLGMCVCGNRRVRSIKTLTPEEMESVRKMEIDPHWIALFEPVEVPE